MRPRATCRVAWCLCPPLAFPNPCQAYFAPEWLSVLEVGRRAHDLIEVGVARVELVASAPYGLPSCHSPQAAAVTRTASAPSQPSPDAAPPYRPTRRATTGPAPLGPLAGLLPQLPVPGECDPHHSCGVALSFAHMRTRPSPATPRPGPLRHRAAALSCCLRSRRATSLRSCHCACPTAATPAPHAPAPPCAPPGPHRPWRRCHCPPSCGSTPIDASAWPCRSRRGEGGRALPPAAYVGHMS